MCGKFLKCTEEILSVGEILEFTDEIPSVGGILECTEEILSVGEISRVNRRDPRCMWGGGGRISSVFRGDTPCVGNFKSVQKSSPVWGNF